MGVSKNYDALRKGERQEEPYKTATDEENGDGDMLQVRRSVRLASAAEMLKEDVGRAVEENEEALDKLGGRTPLLRG